MSRHLEIFKELAPIPKCSRHTEAMKSYLMGFLERCGAKIACDAHGNILATLGTPKVCLQAHYDMVCIGDTEHLEVLEEDGFLRAKNSSLGADNCIGISYMLALLESGCEGEYLFTNDEEIGLIGAKALELSIASKLLINLDTEREKDISLGCAGGFDIEALLRPETKKLKGEYNLYELTTVGFQGGHSGFDIHRGIQNAIIEGVREVLAKKLSVLALEGGEKPNSIPCTFKVTVAAKTKPKLSSIFTVKKIGTAKNPKIFTNESLCETILCIHSGVYDYDDRFDVVSKSLNLSIIKQKESLFHFVLMGRANSNEALFAHLESTRILLKKLGFKKIRTTDRYPAWKPEITETTEKIKQLIVAEIHDAEYKVIHAGFECGVLLDKFPGITALSIGPNIHNPHSLREKVEIASSIRIYGVLEKIIKSL